MKTRNFECVLRRIDVLVCRISSFTRAILVLAVESDGHSRISLCESPRMGDDEKKARAKRSWTPPLEELKTEVQKEIDNVSSVIADEIARKSRAMLDEYNGSTKNDEMRIRLLEEENSLLRVQLKLNIHEKQRLTKKYENCKFDLHDSEVRAESLEKKVLLSEWPIKIRSIIFDVEGDLNLTSLTVCFQCGIVHAPLCIVDKSTRKYPSEAKAQRVFLRRQRWIHVLTTCTGNPRIEKILMTLQMKFNSIHSQTIKDEMTDAEKFISNLEDFATLIFWFSQSVADIFEELSTSLKISGSTCEVENLDIFSAPYDLFATILVNSSIIFNEYGGVKLKSKQQLNLMAKEFIPKKGNKNDDKNV